MSRSEVNRFVREGPEDINNSTLDTTLLICNYPIIIFLSRQIPPPLDRWIFIFIIERLIGSSHRAKEGFKSIANIANTRGKKEIEFGAR